MILLRPMRSDSAPKNDEQRHPQQERDGDDVVRRGVVHLEDRLQIEERVELARIPDHALPCRGAEQRNEHPFQVGPLRERFLQRLGRDRTGPLDVLEDRRFLHLQPDVERNHDEHDGDQEGHPPAPRPERLGRHHVLDDQDHRQRQEQPESGGDLDEAGVEAATAVWDVFGNVDGCSAVLTAEREPLQDPDHEQHGRRSHANRGVGRQHADERGGRAHDDQRHEKRVFPPDQIAYPAEKQRPEGPDDEPDGKGREIRDQRQRVVAARIEQRRDHARQAAEDVEVVPLDHRADGRCGDHLPDLGFRGDGHSTRRR